MNFIRICSYARWVIVLLVVFPTCFLNATSKSKRKKPDSIVPKESQISDTEAKRALAQIYSHHKKNYQKSLDIFQQLVKEKPTDVELNIEIGQLYINLGNFNEGLTFLYRALSLAPENNKAMVAAAQGEAAAGHATKARDLFVSALCSKDDLDVWINYADAMMGWGDFHTAETIFSKALQQKPMSIDLSLKLAWALASQQRYEEAEEIYQTILSVEPNHLKVLTALLDLKILEKDFATAYEIVSNVLEEESSNSNFLMYRARLLFMQRCYIEALADFNLLTQESKFASEAYVWIGKTYKKMYLEYDFREVFETAYEIDPKNIEAKFYLFGNDKDDDDLIDCIEESTTIRELGELANLYVQNGKYDQAIYLYQTILNKDPDYFAARIALAEVLSTKYDYCRSLEIYTELLEEFPDNIKLKVAIARLMAWSKNYRDSIDQYNSILSLVPNSPVLYREKARVAYWGKNGHLAQQTYDVLLQSPEDRWGPYATNLILDSIYLEKHAKELIWNKRYIHSLFAYEELLRLNPGNEEALYDYAQSYCILGLCDSARQVYKDMLNISPGNTLVMHTLARNEMLSNVAINNHFTYWKERGIDTFSQSQIARYRLDTVFEYPITCRSHLRFYQQEYIEHPFIKDKSYFAEGQTVEADYVVNEFVTALSSATYKTYFDVFPSTITCRNRLYMNCFDYCQVTLALDKVDEIYNYFSLKQKIQSINPWISLNSNITRFWNVGGACELYFYNDHNQQVHLNLITEYQFTECPDVFKMIVQGNYRNTAHQSITIVSGTEVVDVIHPYWTPEHYFSGSVTLQVRKDYRIFEFCEAPQRYVDFKITWETDSVNNPSIQAILEWRHDFDCHWGFNIKGLVHRSVQWNADGLWASLTYRF